MRSASDVCNTLHSAIENCDLDSMLSLYSDKAELRIIDRDHPPSHPLELRGKAAISEYLSDIFSREMTHQVVNPVVGNNSLAFSENCKYPDGTRVFGSYSVELENGMIVRETDVQAWDETVH